MLMRVQECHLTPRKDRVRETRSQAECLCDPARTFRKQWILKRLLLISGLMFDDE